MLLGAIIWGIYCTEWKWDVFIRKFRFFLLFANSSHTLKLLSSRFSIKFLTNVYDTIMIEFLKFLTLTFIINTFRTLDDAFSLSYFSFTSHWDFQICAEWCFASVSFTWLIWYNGSIITEPKYDSQISDSRV